MSFLALIGGILLLWLLRHRHRSRPGKAPLIYRLDGRRTFDLVLEGLDAVADFLLAWTRSSRLQPQLLLIVLCTFFVAMLPLLHGGWLKPEVSTPIDPFRSEEHTSELQSLMSISYAVFCLKKKIK